MTGEVVDKDYNDIMAEIHRKLERVNPREHMLLIPRKYYDILVRDSIFYTKDLRCNTIFGIKFEVAEVSKIYVALYGN